MQSELDLEYVGNKIQATIDNETQELPIYKIIKKVVYVINDNTLDTTLNTPIDIDMFITYLADDNTFEGNTITINGQDYSAELNGVATITITSITGQTTYLQQQIQFKNSRLQTQLYQSLSLGEYICKITYNGDRYHQPAELNIHFNISRRKVICTFDVDDFAVYPEEVFNIGLTLTDELNHRKISNCIVKYNFNDYKYITQTNESGYALLTIIAPKIDTNCFDSNFTPTYPLTIDIDNSMYELPPNTTIDISVKKYDTETTYNLSNDGYAVHVEGDIVAYDDNENIMNVDYGYVDFDVTQLSEHPNTTQNVDENGHFNFDVIINATENANIEPSEPMLYSTSLTTVTDVVILDDDASVQRNYRIGQQISFKAHVGTDNDENVRSGMVTFIITQGIEEIYRYITELDTNGDAFFNFDVSTVGKYQIQAIYHAMFEYQASESEQKTYRVTG